MSDHISPGEMPRRSFFSAIANIGGAMIAAVLAIPIVRAALFPVLDHSDANPWSDLGPLENFKDLGKPLTQPLSIARRDGWSLADANQNLYIVAGAPGKAPRVLSSVCPHLGCTVQWRAEQDDFHCPCHGGTFAADGCRISGPPARGMDELPTRVQDGHLFVQFQTYRQLLADKEVAE
jgi:menaquinol-cytochrome c reductase iron-sulfur subunit